MRANNTFFMWIWPHLRRPLHGYHREVGYFDWLFMKLIPSLSCWYRMLSATNFLREMSKGSGLDWNSVSIHKCSRIEASFLMATHGEFYFASWWWRISWNVLENITKSHFPRIWSNLVQLFQQTFYSSLIQSQISQLTCWKWLCTGISYPFFTRYFRLDIAQQSSWSAIHFIV